MWRRRDPDNGQVWEENTREQMEYLLRYQPTTWVRLVHTSHWRIDVVNSQTGQQEVPVLWEDDLLDKQDAAILAKRWRLLDEVEAVRDGDYVRFADGVLRRVSYRWDDGVQTSDDGSYYLGEGYVSVSGSCYQTVKTETLTLTDEVRLGSVWFFRHDQRRGHNGVTTSMAFRVYECSEPAKRI